MNEQTPLETVFGESSLLKILDVLMTHPSMNYSKKELAEAAEVAESTVHRKWDNLEEINALKETRKYGKTQLNQLNQDSEVVKQLFKLDQELRKKNKDTPETVKA